MSTVIFIVSQNHIKHFLSERKKGVVVKATNVATQETGWLYIGHNTHWRNHKKYLKDKITWSLSCYCLEKELSPFSGGNSFEMVKTTFLPNNGLLIAHKVKRKLPQPPPITPNTDSSIEGLANLEEIPEEDKIGSPIEDTSLFQSLDWTRVRQLNYGCVRGRYYSENRYFIQGSNGVIEVTSSFYNR